MAGIYRGHLLEFPLVRVDCFTTARPEDVWLLPRPLVPEVTVPAPQARLHLLTHVHTDHLQGLDDAFTGRILCHPDTKRMLLRLEAERDRRSLNAGQTELVKRKYTGLVARQSNIETLPYGVPKEFDLGFHNGERCVVTITLLDANHCPGSAMFLITAKDKAVVHTGDVRADKLFMSHLMREPVLQEFLVPMYNPASDPIPTRRLDRIYIDTSQSTDSEDMPQKEDSLREMVYCISQYPSETVFFLETWCWGWEEVIIAVAKAFGTRVHVDRYKGDVYRALSTKWMEPFVTSDEDVRFHACEQRFRCDKCKGRRVVQVKMGEMHLAGSDIRAAEFRRMLAQASTGKAEWPGVIVVPFARHSSLPELRNFAARFNPRSLSLNTKLSDRQLYTLHEAFTGAVPDDAVAAIRAETRAWFAASPKHGPDWLVAMDQSAADMEADAAAGPGAASFLGVNLGLGTSTAAGSLLAALLSDGASYFRASNRDSGDMPSPSDRQLSSKQEPEPKEVIEPKEDIEPEADIKPLLPAKETPRKKRRTAPRQASKYAVPAESLSKLIKREP